MRNFLASAACGMFVVLAANVTFAGDPSWTAVLEGAKTEGKVNFYCALPPAVMDRMTAGFSKAHPEITIQPLRGVSGALVAKIDQERNAGVEDGADVFITSEVTWFDARAKEGKVLKPLGPATANWPAADVRDGVVMIGGLEPFIIPYNKTMVTPPPSGYADLLKPEFKGKLSISELNATANIAWYEWLEKTQGKDYLQKLKAQNPKIYTGAVPAAQSIAAGEIVVGLLGLPTATKPLMDQGAPIDYVVPKPAFGVEYPVGALAWGKHNNAARVLVDWLLSREGQAVWHADHTTASPLQGIPGSLSAESIQPYNPTAYTPDVVAKYREYWNGIFK